MPETIYETYETIDVPVGKLCDVIAGYLVDDPIWMEQNKQPNGKWTVRATFAK